MEPLNTSFAKSVDELSANIFIPALISSYLVEIGPWLQKQLGLSLFSTYLIVVVLGWLSAWIVILLVMYAGIYLFKGRDVGPEVGVVIMPLGFAGLFPEQFAGLTIPYSQVTGVAILAWAFMLVKGKRFFRGAFWGDFNK